MARRGPFVLLTCLGVVGVLVLASFGGYYLTLRTTAPTREGVATVTVAARDGQQKRGYTPTDRPAATVHVQDTTIRGPIDASWFDGFGYRVNSVHVTDLAALTTPVPAGTGALAGGSYVFILGRVDSHGFVEVYARARIEVNA